MSSRNFYGTPDVVLAKLGGLLKIFEIQYLRSGSRVSDAFARDDTHPIISQNPLARVNLYNRRKIIILANLLSCKRVWGRD